MFSNLKQNAPQVRQLYINYSTFRQRLVCFTLTNYVYVFYELGIKQCCSRLRGNGLGSITTSCSVNERALLPEEEDQTRESG